MNNVTLMENFKQVYVWPATILNDTERKEFPEWMNTHFGIRVQYLEEVKTFPDVKDGFIIEGTGNRNDLFFAIHNDDIIKFAIPRFACGIRYIEDVYFNDQGYLYPERIKEYLSW